MDFPALSGANMMFCQYAHFLKCIGHIIVLLPTQMNICIFYRHALTVASVGRAVFIFCFTVSYTRGPGII